MARGNSKHLLPAAFAAAVACVALVQAAGAFVGAARQPPVGAAPIGPGIRHAPSGLGVAALGAQQGKSKLDPAWCLGSLALLCAAGSRLALGRATSKVNRHNVRVKCAAAIVHEAPKACQCQGQCQCLAAAPVPVPVQAPKQEAPATPTLIDLEAPLISGAAPRAAPLEGTFNLVTEPVLVEEAASPRASPNRVGAARFVGATRHSQARGPTFRCSSQRAARRAVGAKLQEQPVVEVPEMPFDASRLRMQIQVGLCAATLLRSTRGRESKTHSASKCATATSDARIKEDDCLEEHDR